MFINYQDIAHLVEYDSNHYDKEGFLFVRERKEGILNQWKSETFIERFCRLRGNLLFIINLNNSVISGENDFKDIYNQPSSRSISANQIVFVLLLEECVIKLADEENYKHFSFIIEYGKDDSTKPFHFANISQQERDSWVESIHLSSLNYLRSLKKTLVDLKVSSGFDVNDDNYLADKQSSSSAQIPGASTYQPINSLIKSKCDSSSYFSISCNVFTSYYIPFKPALMVAVFYRTETYGIWNYLDKSEIILSRSAKFAKQFCLPSSHWTSIHLRFKVYDVIERYTNTKILLGESLYISNFSNPSDFAPTIELDICSLVKNSQVIGKLQILIKESYHNKTIERPKSLPLNDFVSSSSNKLHRNRTLSHRESSSSTNRKSFVRNVLPVISPIAGTTISMSYLNDQDLDDECFVNSIRRSFIFDVPIKGYSISVEEIMAESKYCMILPQLLMSIFMEDEKKLMNCVTYALGEVKSEFYRTQMRVLESHLRLVNVVTESINELYQVQLDNRFFRSSIYKKEVYIQYVPINLHFQKCTVTKVIPSHPKEKSQQSTQNLMLCSVGAFAAHYLGFDGSSSSKSISPVLDAWHSMKCYFKILSTMQLVETSMRQLISQVSSTSFSIDQKKNSFALIESRAKKLLGIIDPPKVEDAVSSLDYYKNQESKSRNKNGSLANVAQHLNIKEDLELEPLDLIYLNIKASLISISSKIGNEKCQRDDLEPSSKKLLSACAALLRLSSVCYAISAIKLEREHLELFYQYRLRRGMIYSQALTALVSAVLYLVNNPDFQRNLVKRNNILVCFESLLSCYAQEIGMLNDMKNAVEELNRCTTFIFINRKDEKPLDMPKLEGTGHDLRIVIQVNSNILPDIIEAGVTALLFNIGINEMATLAETLGYVSQQDEINQKSFYELENFITSNREDDPILIEYIIRLKNELWSKRVKNVTIHRVMEEICYKLGGLRFTNCKSAKDRTSMALTLEEVRFCAQKCDLNEIDHLSVFQQMLDTLRSEGTRRENARKNIGIAKYNLNSINVMTFPKLYRPPPGTFGNVKDTQYEMS